MGKDKPKHADFGRRLRRCREALGYESAKEFAEAVKINPQSYRNYERGDRPVEYDMLAVFNEAGMALPYLVRGIGPILDIKTGEKAG